MLLRSVMFVLLAAAVSPARAQAIKEIKVDSVILGCEEDELVEAKWTKDGTTVAEKNSSYEVKAEQGIVKGLYICEDTKTQVKHMFYLKVKVCENCYELSGVMAWGVILGDILITAGVILIVYLLATKNSSGTQKKASNSRSINPPRPPNPDYEALDPKMRSSNALYAGLNK